MGDHVGWPLATDATDVVCWQPDCEEGIGALGNGHSREGAGGVLLDNVQGRAMRS